MENNNSHLEETPPQYGAPVESVSVSCLEIGDFLNFKTRSGSRYIFRVDGKGVDEEGPKILVNFISGPEKMKDHNGRVIGSCIKVGERFRWGKAKTSPIKEIIVSKMPLMSVASKVPLNTSILELEVKLLEIGHVIYAVTNSNDNIYELEIFDRSEATGQPHVKIIGGNNNFVGDMGYLKNMVIGVGMSINTDMMVTSTVKYLEITRNEYAGSQQPQGIRQAGEFEEVMCPEDQMSGIICIQLTKEENDTLTVLNLTNHNLTLGRLKKAWLAYMQAYNAELTEARKIRSFQDNKKFRLEIDHAIITLGYEALLTRLGGNEDEN